MLIMSFLRSKFKGRNGFETARRPWSFCVPTFSALDFSAYISQITETHEILLKNLAHL